MSTNKQTEGEKHSVTKKTFFFLSHYPKMEFDNGLLGIEAENVKQIEKSIEIHLLAVNRVAFCRQSITYTQYKIILFYMEHFSNLLFVDGSIDSSDWKCADELKTGSQRIRYAVCLCVYVQLNDQIRQCLIRITYNTMV